MSSARKFHFATIAAAGLAGVFAFARLAHAGETTKAPPANTPRQTEVASSVQSARQSDVNKVASKNPTPTSQPVKRITEEGFSKSLALAKKAGDLSEQEDKVVFCIETDEAQEKIYKAVAWAERVKQYFAKKGIQTEFVIGAGTSAAGNRYGLFVNGVGVSWGGLDELNQSEMDKTAEVFKDHMNKKAVAAAQLAELSLRK